MAINALDDITFTIPSMTDSRRAEWSGGALSLPRCANSTASPIKQLRWLKMRPAGAVDAGFQRLTARLVFPLIPWPRDRFAWYSFHAATRWSAALSLCGEPLARYAIALDHAPDRRRVGFFRGLHKCLSV